MVIVKDNANKEVSFYRNGIVVQTLTEDCTANLNKRRNGILIEDKRGRKFEVITNQVDEINIKFGASFKFLGGSTLDLWNRLFDPTYSYFNELHIFTASGGGGVVENNITLVNTATYTPLLTDYILWVTVNCTITLPLISSVSIGRVYRIFSRGVSVTINPTSPDLVNGAATMSMTSYEMFTFRAGQANDWGLGD